MVWYVLCFTPGHIVLLIKFAYLSMEIINHHHYRAVFHVTEMPHIASHSFQVKQTGAKPKQRKNWRKSTVQLVPSAPPLPPTAPQNTEPVPRNRDIPLRLPRAMSSPAVDSIPLTDRNAAKPDESMSSNKENVTAVRARSPARPRKNANEKENHLR